ncbi:aspartate and glycine-rich protein-like [Triticum dicoccoides]|uniref:aspartate and glycine-rich protein-like n=1 Tax=Triticum dicoccoides TaxID=85692 RepID=UPI00188F8A7E|nr:aspartate and glycine-rich protein-like [Triticum dicoccoides]XP_044335997.1 aspartate and glycine-rich protein-like [Triticum aestivum]
MTTSFELPTVIISLPTSHFSNCLRVDTSGDVIYCHYLDHAPGNGNNGGDNANGNNLQGAGGDNANVNNPQGAGGNNANVNNPEGAEDDDDDANGNNPQGAGGNNANVNNLQGAGGDNANVNNPQGAGGNNANVNNPQGADDDDDANGNNPQGAGGNNANVNNPHGAEDDDDDDSDDDEDDDDNDKDDGDDNDDDDDEDDANPQGVHGNNLQEDDDLHGDDVADDTVNRGEADGEGQPPPGEIWIGIPEGVKVENDTDDDFEDSGNFDATDTDTFYDAVGDDLMKDNMPKLVTPEHKVPQTVSFTPRSKKPSERSSSHRSNGEVKKSNDRTKKGINLADKKPMRNAPAIVAPGGSWCLPRTQRKRQVEDGVQTH